MDSDNTKEVSGEEAEAKALEHATVRQWVKRIKDAKTYFQKDFDRMKENMEFAAGLQWAAQETLESTQYIANFVNREVNQKVANLYAKDPKAVFKKRERLDFQHWDGDIATMQQANVVMAQFQQAAKQNPQVTQQPPLEVMQAQALLADIQHGKQWQALVDKVGRSLEILYGYQCDTQAPDFKYQMKQLVRRVVTTGVGYVRLNYSLTNDSALTSSGTDDSFSMRVKRAKHILEGIDEDKITNQDPRREQLENLFSSIEASVSDGDMGNIEERLEFDFPSSTSIIVDPKCKSLKGFIGARWIAQQFILPVEDVNAYFETNIKAGGELVTYSEEGSERVKASPEGKSNDPQEKPLCCLWEVFDVITKTSFFIVNGWKDYVQAPEPLKPSITRFWPVFSLTFNDIEVEPGGKVHIYPPSDVQLIKHPQKEWNRSREELRKHRKGNRPFYITSEGWLAQPDKEKIGDHESNELVVFKGIPPNGSLKDNIVGFQPVPIDAALYNTQPLMEDVGLVVGTNQAQNQQPQRHVAATSSVIQEQARMQSVNSNVDDLDDLLSELARASGEIMLKEFKLETVKRIVGVGAVWPEQNREDFLNEVYLDIVAASSGRPNKAVDVANMQQIGPLMLQAGANPWALIKQYCKTLDANIDPNEFAPTTPPQPQGGGPQRPQAARHPGGVGQHQGGMGTPHVTQS